MVKAQKLQGYLKPLSPPNISIENAQRDLPISTPQVRRVVLFLLEDLKVVTNEISIHFVSQKKICQLHGQFFNDPTSTDCITFPIDATTDQMTEYHVLGEVFICPKTAISYATRRGANPYQELYRYLIHCFLHLIGYTDTEPKERAKMKRKESATLKKLSQKMPLIE